jgi:hypothetical protein
MEVPMNTKQITTKEINSFTITIVFYLVVGSLAVYFRVPSYVFGVLLGLWTLTVFSFDFSLESIIRTFYDSMALILGLTPPYLAFAGFPYFTSIFKWYLFTLFFGTATWIVYKMGTIDKRELRGIIEETINEGERDEKSQ